MGTEEAFNKNARKQLEAICHSHDMSYKDQNGSTQGLIKEKTLDNFAIEFNLTVDNCMIIENDIERPATHFEQYADWEKVQKACNCRMLFLNDNLDYMYRVVFYN